MITDIDPRISERRKHVREESARSNARRLIWMLAAIAVVAGAIWLIQSPWLSLSQLVVHGVSNSGTERILGDQQVVIGRPIAFIRSGQVRNALEEDPWIAAARVSVVFPDTVEVEVTERVPSAWLAAPGGWSLVAADGVVLQRGGDPGPGDNIITFDAVAGEIGEAHPDSRVTGAVAFIEGVRENIDEPIAVRTQDGELWADVSGVAVRLGRPVGMGAKASALMATLQEGPPPGSVIILLAPTRPAVELPAGFPRSQGQVEP